MTTIYSVDDLELKRDSFITLLSSRRSGKSYLVQDLVHYFLTNEKNKIDHLYVFSNTAKFDAGDNYKWLDKKVVLPAKAPVMLEVSRKLMKLQAQTNFKNNILIVFDDIDLSSKLIALEELATRGRHFRITVILSAQIANWAISPAIKANSTYLFFRKLTGHAIKEQIFSIVNTFEYPRELYDFTQNNIHDYQFIFYDNDSDSEELKIVKATQHDFEYKLKEPPKKPKQRFTGWEPLKLNLNDSFMRF